MNKLMSAVMAIALVVIAANMTYSNMPKVVPPKPVKERILPVVGRCSYAFDGLGADVGFLVKDHGEFRVVRYDQGSMAANRGFRPAYLSVMETSNGQILYNQLDVLVE